jgi:thiazole tautomerase (transcriptional regulator TenI)
VQALADVSAAVSIPVLAVGGISPETAPQLAGTGCAGFAAIGWFANGDFFEKG